MTLQLYLAFVVAVAALMLLPGPNVALIVANSVAYGTRCGLVTVAGIGTAIAAQLLLVVGGMVAALSLLGHWLEVIRWVGAVYLLWLGLRQWRAPAANLASVGAQPRLGARLYGRAVLAALANPKTLLFYGAFLPQFLVKSAPMTSQLALLAATALLLGLAIDGAWALLAGRLRPLLATRGRWRNRLAGGLLIGAGVGLAVARRA